MLARTLALAFGVVVMALSLDVGAQAQKAGKVWRIGLLRVGTLPVNPVFWEAMRERAWIQDQNIKLEPRYAEKPDQLPALAAELVQLKVDLIITNGTPATLAVKQATKTIPIVFFLSADPVSNGVVLSMARPGGNATGFAYGVYGHKLLENLKAALPGLSRVAYPIVAGETPESQSNPEFSRVAAALDIFALPAGPLALALGAEARRWEHTDVPSADALANDILGGFAGGKVYTVTRDVWAAFAEANAPLLTTLEANLTVRFDHYTDFGGTTNPKVSIRWQPSKEFLMRGSFGTGFNAPGLDALYGPQVLTTTPNLNDPIRCPVTRSPQDCNVGFPRLTGSNPLLQPDKSTQWGVGAVWAPAPGVSLGLDYFDIRLKDALTFTSGALVFQLCPDGITGPTCRYIPSRSGRPELPESAGPDRITSSARRRSGGS